MNRFLDYVVKDRRTPDKNRERVGQNLMILAVFLFWFIINFAIIVEQIQNLVIIYQVKRQMFISKL